MVFNVGTVCVKIAGRDAGKTCVVVEAPKDNMVVIDGETRRRKCNVRHIEPTGQNVKVKAGASHHEVMQALGLEPRKTVARKPAAKPVKKVAVKETKPAAKAKPKAAKPAKA